MKKTLFLVAPFLAAVAISPAMADSEYYNSTPYSSMHTHSTNHNGIYRKDFVRRYRNGCVSRTNVSNNGVHEFVTHHSNCRR